MPDEVVDPTKAGLTPVLNTWTAKHGAVQGQPFVVDPVIDETDPRSGEKTQRPNPNPVYRYTFADGSVLEANWDGSIKTAEEKTPTAGAKPATSAAGLERLDANLNVITDPSKPAVYVRDPNAPAGTQPFKLDDSQTMGDPSTWTPITNPNNPKQVIGLFDPKSGKVGASIAAAAGSKDSDPSKWQSIYRTPGDAKSGIVGQWDPVNNELHAVSQAPDGTQIVTTTNAIYVVDKDKGTSTKVQDITPGDVNKQAVVLGGKVYSFDPKTGSFTLPTNVKEAATVGNSTTLKELVWYDDQGNEVARRPNPNYVEPQTTQGAQSLTARQIQQWNPKTGQWEWVENKGRIVASEALRAMAQQLTGQVIAGDISEDEATKLITAANAKMTNDIAEQSNARGAAGDIIANTRGNAQTGAGLLQQRVQAATGTLQSILGNALQNKNITSIPGDTGANLVQGLQGWTADLMGGQATLDSAARMVQAADPSSNMADPTTQAAVATLKQMLDKHAELTGSAHPAVAATQAAQQSQNTGGMAAPVTAAQQTGVTADPNQWFRDWQARQAADAQQQQLARQIALQNASAPGQVAGQNYGANIAYSPGWTPGMGTTPQPLPGFIAPTAAPVLASSG